jgi:sigma-B regulation protein RsbU (phosphoserine phosphatase)
MEPSVTEQAAAFRHKTFYRKLEEILQLIDEEQGLESMLTGILSHVAEHFLAEDSPLTSGRLYRRDGSDFVIVRSFGARGKELLGKRVSATYRVFRELGSGTVNYFFPEHEHYDEQIEGRLGVEAFAAFYLGRERDYVVAFGIGVDADLNEVMLTLNALRYAISHRLKEISYEGQMREARDIQISLLPRTIPDFAGFDIAGESIPAEEVGGDILDLIEVAPDILGIAVGDASGHGLPAALQARDVVTGLRMGVEKDLKITAVMRRLNHVIHRSGLTSRFVSLLYGEIESGGNLAYTNAGHEPGLVIRANGDFELMQSTGIVMGPLEEAEYGRRMLQIEPGDSIVLYSDGVIERHDPDGEEEFGLDRLKGCLREARDQDLSAREVCDLVLERLRAFGGLAPLADDVTILVIRRLVT